MKLLLPILLFCLISNAQDTLIQVKISTKLRTNGDGVYELTSFVPKKGSRYKFTEYKTGFWKIVENDLVLGWLPNSCIYTPPIIEEIIRKDKLILMKEKYGEREGHKIAYGRIWVGMTREMLIDSKGNPDKINVTRSIGGNKSEQLVYKNQYVYIRNNLVETIQH